MIDQTTNTNQKLLKLLLTCNKSLCFLAHIVNNNSCSRNKHDDILILEGNIVADSRLKAEYILNLGQRYGHVTCINRQLLATSQA